MYYVHITLPLEQWFSDLTSTQEPPGVIIKRVFPGPLLKRFCLTQSLGWGQDPCFYTHPSGGSAGGVSITLKGRVSNSKHLG